MITCTYAVARPRCLSSWMLKRLKPKIGVEIHAQLLTERKLFSEAKVDWRAPVNSQVSPFDCATPGTLPNLNWNCVKLAVRAAHVLKCTIAPQLLFDRKHYSHWDLPAGYQITQKRLPLGVNGLINLPDRDVRIKQIHLEQDSGKSVNTGTGKVLVDLNRAGVGLIELVSEPDLSSPRETSLFVQTVHDLLQDLHVCSGNMEQGAMRIDVNVNLVDEQNGTSVSPRVELKNINAINGIEPAVSAEISRQTCLFESNSPELRAETRLYSPESNETILLRVKDTSESYRYLPEYDLPAYDLDWSSFIQDIPLTRHEIINQQMQLYPRLQGHQDLLLRLRSTSHLASLFNECLPLVHDQRFLLNWCVGELLAILNRENNIESIHFTPESFAKLVESVRQGTFDKELAKSEMTSAIKNRRDLQVNVKREYSHDTNDIDDAIDKILKEHPNRVNFLKSPEGKQRGSVDFFIGPLMKQFRGRITAQQLAERIKSRL